MDSFVNLHAHSSYSVLDGASKIPEMVARTKELGMTGAAITDHGTMSGVIEFYKECEKYDINGILGIEAYFTDDRTKRTKPQTKHSGLDGSDKRYYHLTLLAEDQQGYQNLLKITTDAYLTGHYFKPRTDWSVLEELHEGVIASSGCLGGPILQPLLHGDYDTALQTAARFQDIFGRDNFFIEMMDHGLPEQQKTNPSLVSIANALNAPLIATSDCHYVHQHDSLSQDSLLCIQTGAKVSDQDRFRFANDEYYIKSPAQMREIFKDTPSACDNTLWVNERCNVKIDFDHMHLPKFPVPAGYDSDHHFLTSLAEEGLKKRYGTEVKKEHYERLSYELSVFESMGVSSYFLILWDIIDFYNREGMLTPPGRGSACSSLVLFCLGITKVDPIKYNLIFERFMNPERVGLPDVDLDTEQRYREKLINYAREKYGEDHVAQVVTFGTIKARSAVRDAARVLGFEPKLGDSISKLMPPLVSGADTPLKACLVEDPKFERGFSDAQGLREEYNRSPDVKKVVDVAVGLEGLIRLHGVHAAAVVIGDQPLVEVVPLQRSGKEGEGPVVTQWDMGAVEDVGLLKMDFLGLKTLDVLSDTISLIPGMELSDLDDIPMDDWDTYELLRSGHTVGCFQLESVGMRALLRRLRPDNITDLASVLALYRPGPMAANMHNDFADRKNGSQPAIPFHEDATDILKDTYGLMIFQESLLAVARRFAGYSMADADHLRKAVGKKLPEQMELEHGKFVDGCVSQGYERELGESLFEMIEGFAAYGFNAAHALPYSFLSYWTAYFKTHYPREFMASLCTSVMSDHEEVAVYLAEVDRMGLRVNPPDINTSNGDFTVQPDGVGLGLALVRGIGGGVAEGLVAERALRGPYRGLYDLVVRSGCDRTVLQMLAASGALDAFGTRQGITASASEILKSSKKDRKKREANQQSLFGDEEASSYVEIPISDVEYSLSDKLEKEKESLGVYMSGHPLDSYKDKATRISLADLKTEDFSKSQKVLALVVGLTVKYTKKNEAMAILILNDRSAEIESVCFPRQWEKSKHLLTKGSAIYAYIKPGSDFRDERNYILNGVDLVDSRDEAVDYSKKCNVYLPSRFHAHNDLMSRFKGLCLEHPGDRLVFCYASRSATIDLGGEYLVEPSDTFKEDLKSLFEEYEKM